MNDENPNLKEINVNEKSGLKKVDVNEKPIVISGLNWLAENSNYNRLPIKRLSECNGFVVDAASSTAGVSIHFMTNSKIIGIEVIYGKDPDYSHIPRSGASGFDIYLGKGRDKKFLIAFFPEGNCLEYRNTCDFGDKELREITINFPLYREVKSFNLLLDEESGIYTPTPFAIEKPIVFYGSSITQGACASRPGNCYTNILCRWLDANSVNLGFSSGALAEPVMGEIISEIDMSLFIMDYDYNAPTEQYLEETHEKFYREFRGKFSDIPVIFISRPNYYANPAESESRIAIIQKTYQNALGRKEKVYFVNGRDLFGDSEQDSCTVDGCHPNDLGFMRMAEKIYPVIKTALINEGYEL